MAVTTKWYGQPFANLVDGTRLWDWNTDTIKLSLHTATYAPNLDTQDTYDEVTNEVSSANYTAGGNTLGTPTVTVDSATDEVRLDMADTSWTNVTFTARYGVVYKSTGVSTTSPLIALIDFGADQTVNAGNFSITFDATGVIKADYT